MHSRLHYLELGKFLLPFEITTKFTDIFEETVLKMAGITTKPKKCYYEVIKQNNNEEKIIYHSVFSIRGIGETDSNKFLEFLKDTCHDNNAFHYFDDKMNMHRFEIDSDAVYNHIFPLFKDLIISWDKNQPKILEPYQKESARTHIIWEKKLLDQINLIQDNFYNPINYLNGLYQSINAIKEMILKEWEKPEDGFTDRLTKAYQEFNQAYQFSFSVSENIRHFEVMLKKYYKKMTEINRYYIRFTSIEEYFAAGAAKLQILQKQPIKSENSTIQLPDNISSKVAAFLGDPNKKISQFGPKGQVMLPTEDGYVPSLSYSIKKDQVLENEMKIDENDNQKQSIRKYRNQEQRAYDVFMFFKESTSNVENLIKENQSLPADHKKARTSQDKEKEFEQRFINKKM